MLFLQDYGATQSSTQDYIKCKYITVGDQRRTINAQNRTINAQDNQYTEHGL